MYALCLMYKCMYVHICVCIYVCTNVCMYECVYVCEYVYISAWMVMSLPCVLWKSQLLRRNARNIPKI
jgi:hypothetical protein